MHQTYFYDHEEQVRHRMQRFQATSAQETWALIFSTLSMILHNAPNRYLQSILNIQEQIDGDNFPPNIEIGLHADRRPDGEHF